ncbi:MAG: bifunctional oligoribonuclease/PAP phosphatase NrnA [Verrucomicrobiota bacterium]
MASLETISALLTERKRIGIISHDRPDGDSIGSALGLGLILQELGKETVIRNHDGVPYPLRFLPESAQMMRASEAEPANVDILVVLDSAGQDRISQDVWQQFPEDVEIAMLDHHASNVGFGDWAYIDPDSPATGQIICELAQSAGWQIPPSAAENLYAAISTDTGSFRYPNTTAKTYRIVADLIDAGVNVGKINQDLYESYPKRRVELMGHRLNNLSFSAENRCVSIQITNKLKRQLKIEPGESEGLIDVIRGIDTATVAVIFEEMYGGKIRVSSRSKDPAISVAKICATFGGGGHHLAAGTRMAGPISEAQTRFLTEVEAAFRQQN